MSREDEMRKGAEVIQQHLREPNGDTLGEPRYGGAKGEKTLAGVPRKGRKVAPRDIPAESARLKRLAKVREWEAQGHLTMVPFYSIRNITQKDMLDKGMQAVRVGGVFFEEPEHLFPSDHVFANIALAVKAGVTEVEEPTPRGHTP